jgi:RimJ/RimL family protein N-acetyltransferase
MTQHSPGTPDPTGGPGGTGAPATPFAPVPDSRPVDAPWPEMTWPPAAGVVLRGRVVELAPADPARDAAELFAALDHDDVWRHVAGRPRDADDHARLLEQSLAAGRVPWVVRLVAALAGLPAGTVVGTSTYLDVSVADARLEIGSTAYTPAVWGSAVNPETKLLLLGHAFESLGAGRVQLKTDVRNHRSQQAIARLGAHYEGTLRRYQRRADGTVRDTAMFALLAEDWPAARASLQQRLGAAASD